MPEKKTKASAVDLIGDLSEFGRKLLILRTQLKLTQGQAAERIGVTTSAYVSWEKGKRAPYINRLSDIANGFGVPISYFTEPLTDLQRLQINDNLFRDENETIPLLNVESFEGKTDHREIYNRSLRYHPVFLDLDKTQEYFALKIRGNEMMTSTSLSIPNGSIAVCSTKVALANMHSVPCVLTIRQQAAIVREVNFANNKVILTPWNNKYPEEIYPQNEIQIFGKVLYAVLIYD